MVEVDSRSAAIVDTPARKHLFMAYIALNKCWRKLEASKTIQSNWEDAAEAANRHAAFEGQRPLTHQAASQTFVRLVKEYKAEKSAALLRKDESPPTDYDQLLDGIVMLYDDDQQRKDARAVLNGKTKENISANKHERGVTGAALRDSAMNSHRKNSGSSTSSGASLLTDDADVDYDNDASWLKGDEELIVEHEGEMSPELKAEVEHRKQMHREKVAKEQAGPSKKPRSSGAGSFDASSIMEILSKSQVANQDFQASYSASAQMTAKAQMMQAETERMRVELQMQKAAADAARADLESTRHFELEMAKLGRMPPR
eukprot:CAMPEP_0118951230 /NCGR_PEP_ID=MMETSP1169-20130426/52757_1 /TAXON_ID=36882 /ORGANISM="Pyramimonas obovata, Strain CCMP722" /LENGTH=314 /DNA_ID=CAMNT_0006898247 /DNA_START=8 /DNA_END=952 /DNA_ORIENTATION=-